MADKLLFVGWEGALIERPSSGWIEAPAAVRLTRDVVPTLLRFAAAGYSCVVAANRPGAAASPTDGLTSTQAFVQSLLQSQGVTLRGVHICMHEPADQCACRKPGVGLVADYLPLLDRAASLVVGDEAADLTFARHLGIRGYRLGDELGWKALAHEVLDAPRRASVQRATRETNVSVHIDLDRRAESQIDTGIGFFDHMLEQLGKHGGFELRVKCRGDLDVDEHHTIEDVALTLGQALKQALGDKRGVQRYGFVVPMDEASAHAQVDLGGRAFLVFEGAFPRDQVGGMPTELVEHFFRSLSDALAASIHIRVTGTNTHHMIEACFKSLARALRIAIAREGTDLPSTKGLL